MNPDKPPVTVQPSVALPPNKPRKQRPWLLYIFGSLTTLLLVVIAVFAILLWWSQRPIKPTVLTEAEKTTVEQKLQFIGSTPQEISESEPDRVYVPGSNVVKFTEREINGLLNDNTELGQTVRFEFGRDAVNAYVVAPIPDDVPLFGGKMFRARGRFKLSVSSNDAPVAMLEDVTVYGVSMPKAWLGGLKGENLLSEAMGERDGKPLIQGVKSLRIQPGALVIELEE